MSQSLHMPEHIRRTDWTFRLAIGSLLFFSVLTRWSIWQQPIQIFRDSPGYLVPAMSLLDGHGYGVQENGFRTPTYPLFLALIVAPFDHTSLSGCHNAHDAVCLERAASDPGDAKALRAIVLVQIVIGLGTTVLLFALGRMLTQNVGVALLFGAGYALNPATAYWEISLLTETVTTFLVILSAYLTFRIAHADAGRGTHWALGLVLGALALCHSLFLVFWLLPAAYLAVEAWRKGTRALKPLSARVAPLILIPVLCLGLWSSFNYFINGSFTVSTVSGYVLIQMVAPVVQNAPPGYDGLTQTYVGYRDAMLKETGSHSGAIFRAWPDMLQETNLTWSQLSSKLTQLSFYLIAAYPSSYFSVVEEGMARFWEYAIYHYAPVPEGPAQWLLWFANENWQAGLNVLFWIAPLGLFIVYLRRHHTTTRLPLQPILFLLLSVWYAAFVVALTNFQDNARHHAHVLPFQYSVIVTTLWALTQVRGGTVIRFAPTPPEEAKG